MKELEQGYSFENIPSYYNTIWVKSALVRYELISSSALRLFLVILGLKNCEQIYIGQRTLAERVGRCSEDKIQHLLKLLVELQLIEKKERRISTGKHRGRFTTNIYRICDIDKWLKSKGIYNRSMLDLYQPFVSCPLITDNELRLFAVIKSFEGFVDIFLSINNLVTYTGISKKTLLNVRKSLVSKGLISYERKSTMMDGFVKNQYFWTNEKEWLSEQFIME